MPLGSFLAHGGSVAPCLRAPTLVLQRAARMRSGVGLVHLPAPRTGRHARSLAHLLRRASLSGARTGIALLSCMPLGGHRARRPRRRAVPPLRGAAARQSRARAPCAGLPRRCIRALCGGGLPDVRRQGRARGALLTRAPRPRRRALRAHGRAGAPLRGVSCRRRARIALALVLQARRGAGSPLWDAGCGRRARGALPGRAFPVGCALRPRRRAGLRPRGTAPQLCTVPITRFPRARSRPGLPLVGTAQGALPGCTLPASWRILRAGSRLGRPLVGCAGGIPCVLALPPGRRARRACGRALGRPPRGAARPDGHSGRRGPGRPALGPLRGRRVALVAVRGLAQLGRQRGRLLRLSRRARRSERGLHHRLRGAARALGCRRAWTWSYPNLSFWTLVSKQGRRRRRPSLISRALAQRWRPRPAR